MHAKSRLSSELIQIAHDNQVNDLAFPHEYSEVFATAGMGCIRVWHLATCRELLRISVPNLECNCITFAPVSRVWQCLLTVAFLAGLHAIPRAALGHGLRLVLG